MTPIVWRHTWPERGPDFLAIVRGGQFARVHKTHPDHTHGLEWVWSLTYPAATGLTKQGRAATKNEAAAAIRRGLDEALRWHAERGQPLLLEQDGHGPAPRLAASTGADRSRPGRAVAGGVGPDSKNPPRR